MIPLPPLNPLPGRPACTQAHPELFFIQSRNAENEARAVCDACPDAVRADCLEEGMSEDWGVWGGMNPDERTSLKRRRARKAAKARGAVA